MIEEHSVEISRFAERQLKKLPVRIATSLYERVESVEEFGIREIRKIPGYHDEPLKGHRQGQRSIRLNRSYRAIYEESKNGTIHLIGVLEVNKHDYS